MASVLRADSKVPASSSTSVESDKEPSLGPPIKPQVVDKRKKKEEDELWLGVCVYSQSERCGDCTSKYVKGEWKVTGYSSGEIRVHKKEEQQYVLIGHGGSSISGVWIVLVDESMVVVSLSCDGVTCFWGLECGSCFGKTRFGDLVTQCCLADDRLLVILGDCPSKLLVVDVRYRRVAFHIGGFCFERIGLLRIPIRSGELVTPQALKVLGRVLDPSQTFLVAITMDQDVLFFDFGLRKFILPSLNIGEMERLECCCVADEVRYALLSSHLNDPLDNVDFLKGLKLDQGLRVEGADMQRQRLTVGLKCAFLFQLGISEVFIRLEPDNSLHVCRVHELDLVALSSEDREEGLKEEYSEPGEDRRSLVVATTENSICVARPFTGVLLVYSLDLSSLQAKLESRVRVELPSIDLISVSPYGDDRVCLVDATLSNTLIVLEGFEEVNRIHVGSIPLKNGRLEVKWSSPLSIQVGSHCFDLLSERLVPHILHPMYLDDITRTSTHHRFRAGSVGSMRSASSEESAYDFYKNRHGKSHVGLHYFEPLPGIHGWSVQVSKVQSWSASLFSLLSFFMIWHVDEALDASISEVLEVYPPRHECYRLVVDRKPNLRMVSLLADTSKRWCASHRFTATQTLGLISLFIELSASNSLGEHQQAIISSLVSHYGIVYPEQLISQSNYSFPCFEVLTRFILSESASEDIQIAARLVLQVSIERMPLPLRVSRAAEWAGRLHMSEGADKAAVVVLGMLGCVNPQDLAPATAKLVAKSLRKFVPRGGVETVISAELLARGFYIFAPYLEEELPALLRDLILENDPMLERSSTTASACQRALLEIGSAKPQLFVQTIGREALKPGMHRASLLALNNFLKKRAIALVRYLPSVVEIVIKTLDPSESEIRKACLKFSTVVLQQIVKKFPMAAFHQESQRFAVGTVESIILIYDLRTATKWRILEGHTGPVSAVVFEPLRGETIISYCADESCLRLWQTGASSGFFGLLGIQGSCLKSVKLPPLDRRATPADILQNCALDWEQLVREDGKALRLAPLLK